MRVHVLFFGILKDVIGRHSDVLELPQNSSVTDLIAHYEMNVPKLKQLLPSLAISINQHYATPDTKLKPDDEVALLPPVSGGAPAAGDASTQKTAEPHASQGAHGELPPQNCLHVQIVRVPIESQRTISNLKRGDDGAVVVFEGTVRNQTRGRRTLFLYYEAYEEMALQQMESLAMQALEQFQIRDVALVHRMGRLEIGETSVLIVVASAHRAAAFDACRWLIDTLKRTVPIWKKEHFADGAVWADGEPFPTEIALAKSRDFPAKS